MPSHLREEIRYRKRKCSRPRAWTEQDYELFRNQKGMKELNQSLLSTGLIEDRIDVKYPDLMPGQG
jgi:hypothetical protein